MYNPFLEGYGRPVDPTEMQTRCRHLGYIIPDMPEGVYENPNPLNAIPSAYNDLNKFVVYL